MTKYDSIIGIDPDVDKSGVAVLDTHTRSIVAAKLDFPNLITYLRTTDSIEKAKNNKMIVVVEASWLVAKSNYHAHYGRAGDAISRKVGENHQTGKLIVEMCKYYGIEVETMYPLKKMWKGSDGKITAEELRQICGIKGQTNQEMRDACLIAWCWANFPLSMR
jgi:hypothetical protein